MKHAAKHQVLHALFCLSRDTRHISASTLAAHANITATQAARALVELERAGLVDASRARLTLRGLAAAVAIGPAASGSGGVRIALRSPPSTTVVAAPLAARPTRTTTETPEQPAWA